MDIDLAGGQVTSWNHIAELVRSVCGTALNRCIEFIPASIELVESQEDADYEVSASDFTRRWLGRESRSQNRHRFWGRHCAFTKGAGVSDVA